MARPQTEIAPQMWTDKRDLVWDGRVYYSNTAGQVQQRSQSSSYRTYSGVVTPNFRAKKRAGTLPVNNYTSRLSRTAVLSNDMYNYRKYSDGRVEYDSWVRTATPYTPTLPFDQGPSNDGLIDLNNKALSRLADQASAVKMNVAQFFGERRQLASMLAATAQRVLSAGRALRSADPRAFATALSLSGDETRDLKHRFKHVQRTPVDKRIAQHWLEYIYGWRPLLMDVHDATELMAQKIAGERYPSELYASARVVRESLQTGVTAYGAKILWQYRHRQKMHVKYVLEDTAKQVLAQTGISNPALLAWELLPYSFVVDWFLPVGNYLESLTAFDGFVLKGGYSTKKLYGRAEGALRYYAPWYGGPGSFGYDSWKSEWITSDFIFKREVISEWPSYLLRLKSPIGGSPLTRFATAASLLRVLFK